MASVFPGKREPWDWCPDPVQEQKSGEKNGFRSSGTHLDSDPPHKGFSFGHPHPQLPARPFSLGILHRFPTFLHLWVTRRDGIPGGAAGSAQDYPNNPTGASPATPKPCSGILGAFSPLIPMEFQEGAWRRDQQRPFKSQAWKTRQPKPLQGRRGVKITRCQRPREQPGLRQGQGLVINRNN